MKKFLPLSVLICSLVFMACEETKRVVDAAGNVQLTGSYTVRSIKGEKVSSEVTPTFTLSAIDNSIRGNAGCNSMFGNYSLDLYAISFSDLAVTKKSCDEKSMKTERNLLDALDETGSYSIDANVLTLYSRNDRSILLTATKDKKE